MTTWREQIEVKAKLIHEQLVAARQLAKEFGGDAEEVSVPYLRLLSSLYSEEFPLAVLLDDSDLVVRYEGPAITEDGPPSGLVSTALRQIRDEVKNVAKAVIGLSTEDVKWPSGLDPHLAGIAQGSLIIGVRVPNEEDLRHGQQLSIEGVNDEVLDSVRAAVRSLQTVSRHITDDRVDEGIAIEIPDPAVRDAVLVAAQNLAPSGRKGIERVSFLGGEMAPVSGRFEIASLTPRSRIALRQVLREPVMLDRRRGKFVGVVREIDLDVNRFEIRHVSGVTGGIRCIYPGKLEGRVRSYLDATVEVQGEYEMGANQMPRLIRVEHVKVVKRAPRQLLLGVDPLGHGLIRLESGRQLVAYDSLMEPRPRIVMARNPQVAVEPRKDGKWAVQTDGTQRAASLHDRKSDAIARARELAANKHAELVIKDEDGKIVQKESHANDRRRTKG